MIGQIIGMAGSMWALAGKNYMQYKAGKEDAKTLERISQWERWFKEACAKRTTPAAIIWTEQSTYGEYARRFKSINDWLSNDADMAIALKIYLGQYPNLNIDKNPCPNTTLYLGLGLGGVLLLLVLVSLLKKSNPA